MPSPTIRIWICPRCHQAEQHDFSAGHVGDSGEDWCEGVPAEYVACPTSMTAKPADPFNEYLMIPAPEAES